MNLPDDRVLNAIKSFETDQDYRWVTFKEFVYRSYEDSKASLVMVDSKYFQDVQGEAKALKFISEIISSCEKRAKSI